MKKKIISKFGNPYKVKFKNYDKTHMNVCLYRRFFFIYFEVKSIFIQKGISDSFINFKKEAIQLVELYEWQIGYGEAESRSIKEFLEWDGKCEK